MRIATAAGAVLVLVTGLAAAEPPPTGFLPEMQVRVPTRLDWEFVVSSYGAEETRLPPANAGSISAATASTSVGRKKRGSVST